MQNIKMGLLLLPVEVLAEIFSLLKPVDILFIRATCKILAEATFERLIWHHAFAQVLDQHGAVHSPKQLQSMTREELESAALRPTRFMKTVLASTDNLTPTTTVKLEYATLPYDDIPDTWDTGFSDAILVRGGRFLITVYRSRLISLWNLEALCHQTQRTQPIVSVELATELGLGDPTEWRVSVNQSRVLEDRTTIRLAIFITNTTIPSNFRSCVYEIRPCSHNPTFHLFRLRSNPEFMDSDMSAFDGNYIAFFDRSNVRFTLWDLGSDSSISWQLENGTPPTMLAMKDSKLLLFYDIMYVKIYDISKFSFRESKQSDTLPFVPSYSRTGINSESNDALSDADYLADLRFYITQPYTAAEPLTIVAYGEDEEDEEPPGLHVFFVEPLAGADRLEEPMIYRQASLAPSTEYVPLAWGQYIGESYAVLWAEEIEDSPTILLTALAPFGFRSTQPSAIKKNTVRMAKLSDEPNLDLFDLCPVTMRLVTVANGKVHIMEFN